MSSLSWQVRVYILTLIVLMACAVSFALVDFVQSPEFAIAIFIAAVAIAALDRFPIVRFGDNVEITISNAVKFAVVLLSSSSVVVLSTFLGTLFAEIPAKRSWSKKIFNISQMTLTWMLTAWVYSLIDPPSRELFASVENGIMVMLAGGASFIVNVTLVSMVISLAAHLPFPYLVTQNTRLVIWQELSIITIGIFLAILWRFNPFSVVLAGVLLFIVRDSYRIANHLRNQTQDALRALVRVIDERDHHTYNHSENVSNYARAIAEALGLAQDEIEVIASAALLHDLGKVGMADDILFNPKMLNPAERKRAERHAEVGAVLLEKFPLFDKGAVLVRHHHEHFDGKGYPDGLAGDAIPIGSRIIAVADAYQAMTEDRAYRRALSVDDALARLVEASNTQFDPRVVQVFAKVLRINDESERATRVDAPQIASNSA
ncbi:MAG: HD-GYP domain-containing protein [Chloroflexi bacterium]|nr:HD-GYP domain-containing protein [Chloroflexota bacterium]